MPPRLKVQTRLQWLRLAYVCRSLDLRVILCGRSEYFQTMLQSGFCEGGKAAVSGGSTLPTVRLGDLSAEAFSKCIEVSGGLAAGAVQRRKVPGFA
jgi:hypothetical protein